MILRLPISGIEIEGTEKTTSAGEALEWLLSFATVDPEDRDAENDRQYYLRSAHRSLKDAGLDDAAQSLLDGPLETLDGDSGE